MDLTGEKAKLGWTDTLTSLYSAVCAEPQDLTVKKAFADCCEEHDDQGFHAWADLIKTQLRVSEIGPPRHLEQDAVIRHRGGPGYCQVSTHEGAVPGGFQLGQRIDVQPYAARGDKPKERLHGLRITCIEADGYDGELLLTLAKDQDSTPYPTEELTALHDRALKLLRQWSRQFVHPEFEFPSEITVGTAIAQSTLPTHSQWGVSDSMQFWGFRNGFISELLVPWRNFVDMVPGGLLSKVPLSKVSFLTPVPLVFHEQGARHLLWAIPGLTPAHLGGRSPSYYPTVADERINQAVITKSLLTSAWPTVTEWGLVHVATSS